MVENSIEQGVFGLGMGVIEHDMLQVIQLHIYYYMNKK